MCVQGPDGLSRGQLLEGDFNGLSQMSFVPLHLSAIDHEPPLRSWLHSWTSVFGDVHLLTPFQWFTVGHTTGTFIWSPPPAGADAALEQVASAVHKRPNNHHIVLIPCLMTARW
jgi:hypothetical protein